jgi:hypothetical protein
MVLHSIGPKDMGDDEHQIGRSYQLWLAPILCAMPLATAYFSGDLKWVVAVSAAVLIAQMHEAGGRLYDLCIRIRRTNLLLAERRQVADKIPT